MISIISRSRLLVGAAAALSLLSVPSLSAQTITACHVKTSGSMYRVGTANTPANCTNGSHTKETWNITGPQGPAGPMGPQGPAGPAGSLTLPYQSPLLASASTLFWVRQSGAGRASMFESGANAAVWARSTSNVAVHGLSYGVDATAAGVRAENLNNTGTALNIAKGAIRVSGAGDNTPTAAFKVGASVTQSINTVTIDNPMTNGDPNAILIVTRETINDDSPYRALKPFYVLYDRNTNKWRIRFEYNYPVGGGYVLPGHTYFNVLVIKN